jgi:SpoVK/Ycf46/Vps4 family AAA+-type ATPase
MNQANDLFIEGLPLQIDETEAALCRSRMFTAVKELMEKTNLNNVRLTIGTPQASKISSNGSEKNGKPATGELTIDERAQQYHSQKPAYSFDFLIVPDDIGEEILTSADLIFLEKRVFDEWDLRSIEPYPRTVLNFYGQPGTGKTIAAHAVADYLKRPILVASYAQIESKYHGDGPKNVEAVFFAAERDEAVLFIDEADSLLSKRLTNVTQGSEQAINSMRSQLLISLGNFRGVVIFATNLVSNYDRAFETRVKNIHFPLPDSGCRLRIWKRHFPQKLPLDADVCIEDLAAIEDVCGRDIKNAVINSALKAARQNRNSVSQKLLLAEIERIKSTRIEDKISEDELTPEEKEKITEKIQQKLETND